MNEQGIDPEELAALLDGRLDERERAELLARLDASDEDYEDFLDAAALLADLDAEDEAAGLTPAHATHTGAPEHSALRVDIAGTAADDAARGTAADDTAPVAHSADRPPLHIVPRDGAERMDLPPEPARVGNPSVLPLQPRRRGASRRPLWFAAAAVLAAAALTPMLWRGGEPAGMGQVAELLSAPQAGLPPGWTDERPWRTTLGAEDPMTENGRAARLGVTHTDLEVALAAGDTERAAQLAREAAALLGAVPGGGYAAGAYEAIATRPTATPDAVDAAAEDAAAMVGRDYAAVSAWAEAARLAIVRKDAGFFRSGGSRAAIDQAGELPGLSTEGRAAASALSSATASASPDWAAAQAAADRLLAELAR